MKRAIAAFVLLASASAHASKPQVQSKISPSAVAPGQSFQLQISATTADGSQVQSVHVDLPSGVQKKGERRGTTSSLQISMGQQVTRQTGQTLTLTLRAEREGDFKLGPVRVRVDGTEHVVAGPMVQVKTQPARARTQQPRSLFDDDDDDLFGGMFGSLFQRHPQLRDRFSGRGFAPQREIDPSLGLPRAPSAGMFLHARATQRELILGQSLLFEVRQYLDERYREPELNDTKEASFDDFLSVPLEMRARPRTLGYAEIGEDTYEVRLLRRYALSPLRAGTLSIGAMQVTVTQPGGDVSRQSEPLQILVREPPLAGRPNGYELGSVGRYEIQLEPPQTQAKTGEAVAFSVRVRGAAKPPRKLVFEGLPSELEISEPDIRDTELPAHKEPNGETLHAPQVQRTYNYLLTARTPGNYDLGSLALPSYLVDEGRYEVQRVALGSLQVHGAPAASPSVDPATIAAPDDEPAALALGAPLQSPSGARALSAPLPLWAYATPLALPSLGWLWLALSRFVRQKAPRRDHKQAQKALRECLQNAQSVRDLQRFDKLLVQAALERRGADSTNLGASRDGWYRALRDASVSEEAIDELRALLKKLDAARFVSQAEVNDAEWLHAARQFAERWP